MRDYVNKLIQNNPIVQAITVLSLDLFDESAVLSRHLPGGLRHRSVEPEADDQHVEPDHHEAEDDEKEQNVKVGVIRKFSIVIVFWSFSVRFPFENR